MALVIFMNTMNGQEQRCGGRVLQSLWEQGRLYFESLHLFHCHDLGLRFPSHVLMYTISQCVVGALVMKVFLPHEQVSTGRPNSSSSGVTNSSAFVGETFTFFLMLIVSLALDPYRAQMYL